MDQAEEKANQASLPKPVKPAALSRREFLRAAGAAAATAAGIGALTSSCQGVAEAPEFGGLPGTPVPTALQYPAVPYPPAVPPQPGLLQYFTPAEAQLVEALTARLLPGSPEDPGAREAGVVYYIDNLLAQTEGFAEPTYRQPPFVQVYEGAAPPTSQANAYQVIWLPAEEIERYGYQSVLTPREVFRLGMTYVDRYANDQFGRNFIDLTEDDQDTILDNMLRGRATGFERLPSDTFFHVLRRYTSEGMFSDPAYGGNRNMVGWQLIGYPGAQRAYTPDEIQVAAEPPRPPQSLADLHHFQPGQPRPNAALPVRGSLEYER
jgi:gluconate 2-dehydrogenase gamma chain